MMKAICIKESEGITLDKEYRVINSYGIRDMFRLEVENDNGIYEVYNRAYFSNLY